LSATIIPDQQVITITRSDDTTFGILHSRFHELWSLRLCTWLGKGNDPRYTPTTTFETFPFPEGLTPADTAGPVETREDSIVLPSVTSERRPVALAIAQAAHRLNDQRENWLNPPTWVERVPEVVPGYPDRIIPKPGYEKKLKAQTLTNLYNQRPTWLDNAHQALDAAVAVAYGWADYSPEMPDEVILSRLLALNLERAKLN
ncbi:MAG: class I SAM-dependent DNA methyltransferase, partial [Gammaproteobacteria bacterium]|nr:class I SAM-dependent DNA methyltransferase [Gammaproteobacteria bacterium]